MSGLFGLAASFIKPQSPGMQQGGASGYGQANTSEAIGKAYNSSPFDSSNWTVATGSASASATNSSGSGLGGAIPDNQIAGIPMSWIVLGLAAIVVLKVVRK